MFAAGTHALLGAARPDIIPFFQPEKEVLELVHTGIGEKQGRVVLRNEIGAGDYGVTTLLEVCEEFCSYFFACHLFSRKKLKNKIVKVDILAKIPD
jgi:hypothetical protein